MFKSGGFFEILRTGFQEIIENTSSSVTTSSSPLPTSSSNPALTSSSSIPSSSSSTALSRPLPVPERLKFTVTIPQAQKILPCDFDVVIAATINIKIDGESISHSALAPLLNDPHWLFHHFYDDFLAFVAYDFNTEQQYTSGSIANISFTLNIKINGAILACLSRESISCDDRWITIDPSTVCQAFIEDNSQVDDDAALLNLKITLQNKILMGFDNYIRDASIFEFEQVNVAKVFKALIETQHLTHCVGNLSAQQYRSAKAARESFDMRMASLSTTIIPSTQAAVEAELSLTSIEFSLAESVTSSSSSASSDDSSLAAQIQLEYIHKDALPRDTAHTHIIQVSLSGITARLSQTYGIGPLEKDSVPYRLVNALTHYAIRQHHIGSLLLAQQEQAKKLAQDTSLKRNRTTSVVDNKKITRDQLIQSLTTLTREFEAMLEKTETMVTALLSGRSFESDVLKPYQSMQSIYQQLITAIDTFNASTTHDFVKIPAPEYTNKIDDLNALITYNTDIVTRLSDRANRHLVAFMSLFFTQINDLSDTNSSCIATLLASKPDTHLDLETLLKAIDSPIDLASAPAEQDQLTPSSSSTPGTAATQVNIAAIHLHLYQIARLLDYVTQQAESLITVSLTAEGSKALSVILKALACIPEKIATISGFIGKTSDESGLTISYEGIVVTTNADIFIAHLQALSTQATRLSELFGYIPKLINDIHDLEALKAHPILVMNRFDKHICEQIIAELGELVGKNQLPPLFYQPGYEKITSEKTPSINDFYIAMCTWLDQHYALTIPELQPGLREYLVSQRLLNYQELLHTEETLSTTSAQLLQAMTRGENGLHGIFVETRGRQLLTSTAKPSDGADSSYRAVSPSTNTAARASSEPSSSTSSQGQQTSSNRSQSYYDLQPHMREITEGRMCTSAVTLTAEPDSLQLIDEIHHRIKNMLVIGIHSDTALSSTVRANLKLFIDTLKTLAIDIETRWNNFDSLLALLLPEQHSLIIDSLKQHILSLATAPILTRIFSNPSQTSTLLSKNLIEQASNYIHQLMTPTFTIDNQPSYIFNGNTYDLLGLIYCVVNSNMNFIYANNKLDNISSLYQLDNLYAKAFARKLLSEDVNSDLHESLYTALADIITKKNNDIMSLFQTVNLHYHLLALGAARDRKPLTDALDKFIGMLMPIKALYTQLVEAEQKQPELCTYQPFSGQIRLGLMRMAMQMFLKPKMHIIPGGLYMLLWALNCTDDLLSAGILYTFTDMMEQPKLPKSSGLFGSSTPSATKQEQAIIKHFNADNYRLGLSQPLFNAIQTHYQRTCVAHPHAKLYASVYEAQRSSRSGSAEPAKSVPVSQQRQGAHQVLGKK